MHRCTSLLLFICAGCGAAAKEPETAQSPAPRDDGKPAENIDIEKMLAREASGLEETAIKGPQDAWTAKAPASGAPKIGEVNGVSVVDIPIGGEGHVRCQVFAEEVDAAGMIAHVLSTASGKVHFRRVVPTAVSIFKETPAAFVETFYDAPVEGGSALGHLKLAVYPASPHPVLCLHDEVGYSKTFKDVASRFYESFEVRDGAAPAPSFVEIQVAEFNGVPVGFSKMTVTGSVEDRRISTENALFMPTSENELRLSDTYSVEKVGKDGRVAEKAYVKAALGQVVVNVTLKHDKGAVYRYEGTIQDKKIEGEIRAPDKKGLASSIAEAKELAAKRQSKSFALVRERYSPENDAEKLIREKIFRDASDPENTVHYESGEIKAVAQVDDQGLFESMTMPIGPGLHFRRQFIRGKFAAK